jgi:hypothetical protein
MSDILLDQQSAPSAPSAGTGLTYFDSTSKLLTARTSVAPVTVGGVRNASIATQAYTTSEIYLAGSALAVPSHLMQAGAIFRWTVNLTKTAGTGALVWIIRVGTAGTTADTARVTFTQASTPTSATDDAYVVVEAILRNTGAAGILAGSLLLTHVLAITGFSQLGTNVQQVTSAGFDTTVPGTIVGLTFNHSTAGAGNIEMVTAALLNS